MIRAITLHQPWAAAIALGWKQIETRHWYRKPGGLLAIHSAKKWDGSQREAARRLALLAGKEESYFVDTADCPANQRGAIVCVAHFAGCAEMTEDMIAATPALERAFGGWEPGRFAWEFEDVIPLPEPVPLQGRQSIWTLGPIAEQLVRRAAGLQELEKILRGAKDE